jgi:hypothetical protein
VKAHERHVQLFALHKERRSRSSASIPDRHVHGLRLCLLLRLLLVQAWQTRKASGRCLPLFARQGRCLCRRLVGLHVRAPAFCQLKHKCCGMPQNQGVVASLPTRWWVSWCDNCCKAAAIMT